MADPPDARPCPRLRPQILSLQELRIEIADEIRQHLLTQYRDFCPPLVHSQDSPSADQSSTENGLPENRLDQVLQALKRPPSTSIVRVNQVLATREQVVEQLRSFLQDWMLPKNPLGDHTLTSADDQISTHVTPHPLFEDVICVDIRHHHHELNEGSSFPPLATCRIPPLPTTWTGDEDSSSSSSTTTTLLFDHWPGRQAQGWPLTHRVLLCDRQCGEAVLRGSDLYVRGVLASDPGISQGETVAVYAHLPFPIGKGDEAHDATGLCPTPPMSRGMFLDQYDGRCVFLGLGTAACSRADLFRLKQGLAVTMSRRPSERAGPVLPPLGPALMMMSSSSSSLGTSASSSSPTELGSALLSSSSSPPKQRQQIAILQNLPSVLVGHALDVQPGQLVLDMCSAPGGKASHVASLMKNDGWIVSCDKSRKKMVEARSFFQDLGLTCLTPLVLNTTFCCCENSHPSTWKSVAEILAGARPDARDGLLCVNHFYPESFDRIILDPPCSALGLRPKLHIEQTNLTELQDLVAYQRKFVHQAVLLLRPGGILTYSTCTIHAMENEGMVRYLLDQYGGGMELVSLENIALGRPGLPGVGLDDLQRHAVRRFDPADTSIDTMGFFLAKFRKTQSMVDRRTGA